VLIFKSDSAKG